MTNHWIDLKNSDCILIQGSNAAENHPISFKWVLRAKDKGATVIHVDPRFTRTSARSSMHAPIRVGTDIAFFGGMISHIIRNNLYFNDYVKNYTNAAFLVNPKFSFKDGIFSGFDAKKREYDRSTWTFQKDSKGMVLRDDTLKSPNCVFQLMKKHYERYDVNTVNRITGMPKDDIMKVYKAFSATGKADKSGTIMYALGQTHHTVGVQNIRAIAMIQLLLGNIGICGGGVNALRGEPNVQGSTDHALLYHIIPGYMPAPNATQGNLDIYRKAVNKTTSNPNSLNWWKNGGKYATSLMLSMFPDAKDAAEGYTFFPKLDVGQNCGIVATIDDMYKGKIKGYITVGQNPCCSLPNANKTRAAMAKLDWLMHVNIFDNESASFWKGPGLDPKKVKTECFLLPATASFEKEGSQCNSGRWMQWKYKAAKAPGDALSVGDIYWRLMSKIKELYKKEGGAFPGPILASNTNFVDKDGMFDPNLVAKQVNGLFLRDITIKGVAYKKGECVPSFALLQDDGSTSCGNWICSGSFTRDGKNKMMMRGKKDPTGLGLFPDWSFAWPVNRRIVYNRASVDMNGNPYNPKRALLAWKDGKWVGDVPDGGSPPMAKKGGILPFIMQAEGVGAFFGPGRVDGPFPEHYEPAEGPLKKNVMSSQRSTPVLLSYKSDMDHLANADPKYPLVMTTYSCTEHWCTGAFTRPQPWLLETQPAAYVEMSVQLAKERGIKNGEKIRVKSARGQLEAVAMVTVRMIPLTVDGKTVHQVGMTYNYGWLFPKDGGDSANLLTPTVVDANAGTPEFKAFMVTVEKL